MAKRKYKRGKKGKGIPRAIDYLVKYGGEVEGYKLKRSCKRGYVYLSELSEKQFYEWESKLADRNELGQKPKISRFETRAFGEFAEKVNKMSERERARIEEKLQNYITNVCLPKLTELQRRVYELLYNWKERTHEEIARILREEGHNISKGNISTIQSRIDEKVGRWVKEKYPQESKYMPDLLVRSDRYPGKKSHQRQSGQ